MVTQRSFDDRLCYPTPLVIRLSQRHDPHRFRIEFTGRYQVGDMVNIINSAAHEFETCLAPSGQHDEFCQDTGPDPHFDDSTGGTRLSMVESGFAHLGLPTDEATDRHRANSQNWPGKLDQLRADCEQTTP